ncbi:hypothetical protein NITLEN_30117 [Nitrospira lenta]|uniref:Uncharacterized protein n=1 Tax=Nitrospira lenta TaxID=1436998 RepID=A0A330L7V1_9BACT|nr:hypothetical protein NITLEN_30117 [Nitrospira lenta]
MPSPVVCAMDMPSEVKPAVIELADDYTPNERN